MIALLLVLLVALFGVSSANVNVGGGSSDPATTTMIEDQPAVGVLERVEVERSGGIAFGEVQATITDAAVLAELSALLPDPGWQPYGPTGVCSDCWRYRIVLDFAGANEAVLLEFDQASEPPALGAFVDALDAELE